MTSAKKDKGDRAERELVERLHALGLVYVERAYGAGRPDDRGDLDGLPGIVAQVKSWADPWAATLAGLRGAEECLDRWQERGRDLDAWPVVFTRAPRLRDPWIASLRLPSFAGLYLAASS